MQQIADASNATKVKLMELEAEGDLDQTLGEKYMINEDASDVWFSKK